MMAIGTKHLDLEGNAPENLLPQVDEMPMLEDLLASGIFGSKDEERRHSSSITLGAVARQKQGNRTGGSLIRSLFPRTSSLEGRYLYLKKYPWLLPIAWISRLFRFVFKRGGADNAAKSIRLGTERLELLKQYGILDKS